jgi:hypothetical protein
MAKNIAVLPEIKTKVHDGDYCFWDVTVQSGIHLPTFRRKLLFPSTGRILEKAVSSKHR